MSGVVGNAASSNPRIVHSVDHQAAVWLGAIEDLWCFGEVVVGPWKATAVTAGAPSDPCFLTGYDRKNLMLSHTAAAPGNIRVEVDLSGSGHWVTDALVTVSPGKSLGHEFAVANRACWLRVTADAATTATAWLVYE